MPALTVTECYTNEALQIGDGQIIQATEEAAELYGFDRASCVVGQFASTLQTAKSKYAGNVRWVLRQEGHSVASDYCTIVRRPDGELVGVRGELTGVLEGIHGKCYLQRLELVTQLDEPTAPDLSNYGISPEQAETHTGKYTVHQFREALNHGTLDLSNRDLITRIVSVCEDIATEYYGWPIGMGLDFALRRDLCTWSSREPETKTLVRVAATCDRCGYSWWRKPAWYYQCAPCKKHHTWVPDRVANR